MYKIYELRFSDSWKIPLQWLVIVQKNFLIISMHNCKKSVVGPDPFSDKDVTGTYFLEIKHLCEGWIPIPPLRGISCCTFHINPEFCL